MKHFIEEVKQLKVHRNGQVVSLHKPLLLLLTISEINHGHQNLFLFEEVEPALKTLLSKYGLKNTAKINAQYPFVYLASNPDLWNCSFDKNNARNPDSVSRKELAGATGHFNDAFY